MMKGDAFDPDAIVIGLAIIIALFTVSSVRTLGKAKLHLKNPNLDDALYEDEDGTATVESMAEFSTRKQFTIIFIVALVGLTLSIADAIFTSVHENFDLATSRVPLLGIWFLIPAWVCLLLQFIVTAREVQPVARFQSAISRLVTCTLIAAASCVELLGDYGRSHQLSLRSLVTSILTSSQILAVLIVMATVFAIRRRPAVFHPDGRIIDEQMNGSLWSRYSFHWCVDIIAATSNETVENSDLPAMDHIARSKDALSRFQNMVLKENSLPLWLLITWQFWGQLLWMWLAILLSNFFDVAPAFATLQLLKYLENRKDSTSIDPMAWKYVLGIMVTTISSHMIDSRIMWRANSDIVIPLRSTLTALMYTKLMKMKDSSEPPKDETIKDDDPESDGTKRPSGMSGSGSRQDIVNLFAVDCSAIASFGAQNTDYINTLGKLIVTVVFLLVLIGWQSLCAGMIGIVILFPINKALGERYGKKQIKLMKIRDKRTAITTEALQGIRQIKFSALENQWIDKLNQIREEELSMLWKTRLNNLYMSIASEFTPIVLTAFSLATYSYINGRLLPSVAFTSISLFLQLDGIVSRIPYLMVMAINAKVGCDRIQHFLRLPEKPDKVYPGESISFHDVSVTFPHNSEDSTEDRFTLRALSLQFPNNALSVISGPTGSGKSLLLASILGEVEILGGYIQVPRAADERYDAKATTANWIIPSAISFVSQTPWIENATIKNNILFGLPYDPVRYRKVVEACALSQDLGIFEDGDETEVGAQGISLSGGQKWRLTLARAFYSRAGIIIMDDVFSALDAHVGKHIYDRAVMGDIAKGRTRILATHHVALCLPRAKYAVRLSASGMLEHAGLIDELRQSGTLDKILQADDSLESVEDDVEELLNEAESNGSSTTAGDGILAAATAKPPPKKLIEDEKREVGRVKTSVYTQYLNSSGGWPFWSFLALLFIAAETLTIGRTYWVRIWASAYGQPDNEVPVAVYHYQQTLQIQIPTTSSNVTGTSTRFTVDNQSQSLMFYLGIYCFISIVSVSISISRLWNVYTGSIRASRKIFTEILHSVLRANLRWFDTVPTGRILNRFTGDFTSLDTSMAQNFYYFANVIWELFGIMGAAFFVSPYMILCAAALLALCSLFARSYITAARNVKRLESTNKSPVISHFAASLTGLATIRASAKVPEFSSRMFALIDTYASCTWHNSLFRNWLKIRIGITASLFSATVATFIIATPDIDASLAGFALSFALSFAYSVSRSISISTQMELDMNAAERIFEYRDVSIEDQGGDAVRASWPEKGKIEVRGLEVGYADDLPSILKGLSFTAEPNQRIGVVGRTGAGKSTLSLAIFRFLRARKGSIVIDDVDIANIKLHDLRTRLAIIPQDPVLFSGTIRSNLDPFNQFSDYQLREALSRVHLIPSASTTPHPETASLAELSAASSTTVIEQAKNTNIFLSLSSPIASGGSNLSQGQKQLLCLARAILSRPKVLLLDEATSAVDMATDILIQRSIREEFANTTLLVVAHRLSTVADFDRILVMKDGVTAEFGSPKELLCLENGLFRDMVGHSGEKEELEKMILSN